VLLEIPTYPYDGESLNAKFSDRLIKQLERFYRRSLYKYITRIITFSNERKIFGLETINIHNGIDLSSIALKESSSSGKDIHLIAVAVMNVWHGYDRLIEGMNHYYRNNPDVNVYLHIVGDGADVESERYKKMVVRYGLEKFILFHGFCTGSSLDHLFDKADLAIGPLGFHRVQVSYVTPIKLGEYTARGIPFVYSGSNLLFDKQPFVYKVPADESIIQVEQLVEFLGKHKFSASKIRKFAEENLTWEEQMRKVLNEIGNFIPRIKYKC
jgi:glycosyltransferase involved in cell wall biosynthesis